MLINCPECTLQVSDKAISCPHCGIPLTPITKNATKPSRKKHQRLPNGFGRITKLNDKNLRAPYRAMVTVGKDEFGKPIGKLLKPNAYFKTYNEAYTALIEYNKNPYDFDADMTLKEVYEKWSVDHFKQLTGESSIHNIEWIWSICSPLYNTNVKSIRTADIKKLLADSKLFESTATRVKTVLGQVFNYAIEHDIITKNPANFKLSADLYDNNKENTHAHAKKHITFTREEINKIYSNIGKDDISDMVYIQCYMGWRPSELLDIKLSNVDLDNWVIVGGSKTESGRNRTVPIHKNIRSLITKRYNHAIENGSECLFLYRKRVSKKDNIYKITNFNYDNYQFKFKKLCSELELNMAHSPHDCRKHFITKAKEYNMNEYALKRIVGHYIRDITEAVYTERNNEWLSLEMEKIEKI